jgi:hypothetical protein
MVGARGVGPTHRRQDDASWRFKRESGYLTPTASARVTVFQASLPELEEPDRHRNTRDQMVRSVRFQISCGFHGFWPIDSTGFRPLIPPRIRPPVPRVFAHHRRKSPAVT